MVDETFISKITNVSFTHLSSRWNTSFWAKAVNCHTAWHFHSFSHFAKNGKISENTVNLKMCCNVLKRIMCVCCVSPTHCKMQGTGMNFLHFAETFGFWIPLACKGHSENQIHGTEKHHFRTRYWKFHHQFAVISMLHINYTARPSQQNHLFRQCND